MWPNKLNLKYLKKIQVNKQNKRVIDTENKRWLPEAVADGEICKIGQGDGEVQKKKRQYINETK